MIDARFTDEMKHLLANMRGHEFVSYQCDKGNGFPRAYAKIRLRLDDCCIDLSNEVRGLPFFGETEEIAVFSCESAGFGSSFEPGVIGETRVEPLGGIVESVEIAADRISVNGGEYEIVFDMALIVRMEQRTVMFSKGVWFSEVIDISEGDDLDSIYPVESVKEHWNNFGDWKVEVKRTRQKLA